MSDKPINSTIRLVRTGSADVTFTGRELARSDGSGADRTRWHELSLYAMDPQGYALSIRYRTQWEGEHGRDEVCLVGTADDVVSAVEDHDPTAAVTGYPPGEQYAAKQARLLADIRSRYEHQVSDLLRQADITVEANTLTDPWTGGLALRRYRDLLRRALAEMTLTRGEACLICDALNGTALFAAVDDHDGTYMFIPVEITDSIRLDRTDQKWEVDGKVLLDKLAAAAPVTLCAIADACEQFWARCGEDTDTVLREVGLIHGD